MMFKRQFNPPADVPEYEGANQNSMTVEEFYQSTDFPELDKHDRKVALFTYYELLDFAERYAEQSAPKWIIVKERLPERDKDSTNGSELILGFNDGFEGRCWYDFDLRVFRDMRSNLLHLTHWQPLPEPPK
jgi:Protein of unknown function (DUF551)